jgi:hypothetical protein
MYKSIASNELSTPGCITVGALTFSGGDSDNDCASFVLRGRLFELATPGF